jgi:hypothetical protein
MWQQPREARLLKEKVTPAYKNELHFEGGDGALVPIRFVLHQVGFWFWFLFHFTIEIVSKWKRKECSGGFVQTAFTVARGVLRSNNVHPCFVNRGLTRCTTHSIMLAKNSRRKQHLRVVLLV